MTQAVATRHPAKFSTDVLGVIGDMVYTENVRLGRRPSLLDPFAGVGKIHELHGAGIARTYGIELEEEWASQHPRTKVGDALKLPYPARMFDVVATSPCLEQSHRVLTDDLRWVAVGDIGTGDRLLAFDEYGVGVTGRGNGARRRWQRAEVVRSVPRTTECVRVVLANGEHLITTPDHPWLTYPYPYRGVRAEWLPSSSLAGRWVQRQVEPWMQRRSYDAGWLAGMFDGEGSLSLGAHGSPKMTLCQVDGPVMDRCERLMFEYGYEPNRIWRAGVPAHRSKISNLYVTGGFPGLLRALGELRPARLLDKWAALDITSRTVQAQLVEVLAVEPAGCRDIQEIETTTGTYFGEGYLHHNCYGNRMADHHNAKDSSRRNTYRHALGRPLTEGSSAGLQWGADYKFFHIEAWLEVRRVLKVGGLFVLNVSNHIRGGREMLVAEWHMGYLLDTGWKMESAVKVGTPRNRQGANGNVRVDGEWVIGMRKVEE